MVDMTQYFQLDEPVRQETISVGTSQVSIANRRPQQNRRAFYNIRNTGASNVTISFGGGAAVITEGQILKPGESMTDSTDTGYLCYQDSLNAIGDAAGGSILIIER